MLDLDSALKDFPIVKLEAGDTLLKQGETTDSIYFLIEGDISVLRDEVEVATTSSRDDVFGEMSVILDEPHSATVRCTSDASFYQIKHPMNFLDSHPDIIWHITRILSRRLANLNRYLIDIKHEYDDEHYMTIVDETLKMLRDQR